MPNYHDLRTAADYAERDYARVFPQMTDAERVRCITGLMRLKIGLASQIPARRTETNLLVASWNIKEFGHTTQRLPEAYFYIAETLAAFDLIAVQEVKSTLKDLEIVMRLLGEDWKYIVNDITDGTDGNAERSAYIYNTRRVRLSGLAGEIALWDAITHDSPLGLKQLKRSPYMTGFIAGWKKFALVSLHLHPGDDDEDVLLRGEEVRLLLKALKAKRKGLWSDNLILCGDMNLYDSKDQGVMAAMAQAGYRECEGLIGKDTNATLTEAYDRMFFTQNDYFHIEEDETGTEQGGVFNPFGFVYRDADADKYLAEMVAVYGGDKDLAGNAADRQAYYVNYWRKNQISDHFPIWAELVTDDSGAFLAEKLVEHQT
ncbi:endonuclease/exonuclease/phosphatase family protein [Marivivens marinus]|uniref:endonuclease/exonuclease/phosphatase family protein n=1 Tax=Marivivens marinus TaxID=3110173 RepID=UPI003B8459F1